MQLTAGISTLMVSIFYLVPKMVGAGALVTPLLGLPHYLGVIIVGTGVIFIVAIAGMRSTTHVQFTEGALLIVFSVILVGLVINKGLSSKPSDDYHEFTALTAMVSGDEVTGVREAGYAKTAAYASGDMNFVGLERDGIESWLHSFSVPVLFLTFSSATTP